MDHENSEVLALLMESITLLTNTGNGHELISLYSLEQRFLKLENIGYWLHSHSIINDENRMGPWGMQVFLSILSSFNIVCHKMYDYVREQEEAFYVLEIILRARQYYLFPDIPVSHIYYYATTEHETQQKLPSAQSSPPPSAQSSQSPSGVSPPKKLKKAELIRQNAVMNLKKR